MTDEFTPPAGLCWQRASRCVGTGHCVEVAHNDQIVWVRNSQEPTRYLTVDLSDWRRLLTGIRSGETLL
jgi:hypothetical protein